MCSSGHVPGTDFGPVISVQAKKRICDLVQSGIDEGARCVLDGRSLQVPGFEKGNFIGPTILTEVKVSCLLAYERKGVVFDSYSKVYSLCSVL